MKLNKSYLYKYKKKNILKYIRNWKNKEEKMKIRDKSQRK